MLVLEWKDKKSGALQIAVFDVVSSETHESLMAITEHPVEEGIDVIDNARPKPKKLSLTGFVSNKPLLSNWHVSKIAKMQSVAIEIPTSRRGTRPARTKLTIKKPPIAKNLGALVTAGIGALTSALSGGDGGTYATLAKQNAEMKGPFRAQLLKAIDDYVDRAYDMYTMLLVAQQTRALVKVTTTMAVLENMLFEKISVPRTVETGNGAEFDIDLTEIRIVQGENVDAPEIADERGKKEKSLGSQAVVKEEAIVNEKRVAILKGMSNAAFGAGPSSAAPDLPGL